MSSDRIGRKRRSEFDTSDNSADELPAVKIRRLDSAINIGNKVSKAFKNLLNWITPEFVKKMAVRVSHSASSSSLRMGTENNYRNQYPIDVEDDDEECAVVSVQNGTGSHPRSSNTLRMDSHSRSARSSNSSFCPLASTPPCFSLSAENPCQNKESQNVERKKVNGLSISTDTSREEICRPKRSEKSIVFAPITNPRSAIQILLDEDKDIEIISEVYPAKHSSAPTRKIRLLSDSRGSRSDRTSSMSNMYNGARSSYSPRSYTANEVVRLQERAQYRLLLDKVVKRKPLYRAAFPKEDSQTSVVQVDLTESDDIPGMSCYFKREKLEANVNNFLSTYYKPNIYVTPADRLNHTQSVSEKAASEDDDDIKIIEYPELPKWKPRKSSLSSGALFSDEWIEDLKISMVADTEKMFQGIFENEEKVQRFKKRREARIAEDMRIREEQRLAGIIFPEDVEMEEETFPEITPEMDAIIAQAFGPGSSEQELLVLNSGRENLDMKRGDMATLANLNWLNDQVINYYMGLIEIRSKLDGYPSAYCFSSFFYLKLKKEGPGRGVLRWTRKTDIFAKDLIIVPLHLELHWALLVVDNRTKVIRYYDSMGSGESMSLKIFENYLITEMLDKKKAVLQPNTYSFEIPQDIPKQMNGSDCGMFTLKYAEYISRDAPLTFSQENMAYFRRRMVYEIMTKQLL